MTVSKTVSKTEDDFFSLLASSLTERSALRVILTSPVKTRTTAERITVRPVNLGGRDLWQATTRESDREVHRNLDVDAVMQEVRTLLGEEFRRCHLHTPDADYDARKKASGRFRLSSGPPSLTASGPASHDRRKSVLIPDGEPCPFLIELGVMTREGRVRSSRQKKFRQINQFLENIAAIYSHLPADGPLGVVDFGCGKSYLTFALHHYLTGIRGREVRMIGVDRKRDAMAECNRLATTLHCDGLRFVTGDLNTFEHDGPVHLSVALHACDTATDVALARSCEWATDVILAAPCCQHEIAAAMKTRSLTPLTTHGILKERFASLATDALRARLLDLVGYSTKVIEFIETEHTPKNLLIRAIRRDRPRTRAEQTKWTQRYEDFKDLIGIESFSLEVELTRRGFWGEVDDAEDSTSEAEAGAESNG